jgi:hypothetical protein
LVPFPATEGVTILDDVEVKDRGEDFRELAVIERRTDEIKNLKGVEEEREEDMRQQKSKMKGRYSCSIIPVDFSCRSDDGQRPLTYCGGVRNSDATPNEGHPLVEPPRAHEGMRPGSSSLPLILRAF